MGRREGASGRHTAGWLEGGALLVLLGLGACTALLGDDFEVVSGATGGAAGTPSQGGEAGAPAGGNSSTAGAGGTGGHEAPGGGGAGPAPGTYDWSVRFGDDMLQQSWQVAVDEAGQSYVVGDFAGTVDFGGTDLTPWGVRDLFVLKLSPNGDVLWVKQFGAPDAHVLPLDVAISPDGEPLVVGHFYGNVDFGGTNLYTTGPSDIDGFVLQLSPNGSAVWARGYSATDATTERQVVNAAAFLADGQIVIGGNFVSTVGLGGSCGSFGSPANLAIYVGVLDASGNCQRGWQFGTGGAQSVNAIAVSPTAGILVTGTYDYILDFGFDEHATVGGNDMYLVAIDPTAGPTWSRAYGSEGDDGGADLAVSSDGDISAFSGWIGGDVDYGTGSVSFGGGFFDGVIGTFHAGSAEAIWARSTTGALSAGISGVSFGPNDELYLGGVFNGTIDLGAGPIEAGVDVVDFLLAELTIGGTVVVAQRFGGTESQWAFPPWPRVAASPLGGVVLAGSFLGSVDFGGGPLVAQGEADVFVAKYY